MGTAERRTEIMRVLCRRRHETISNLADEFGVSTRTILRDIEVLSVMEPIYTQCGRYGGVYVTDDYSMSRMYMSCMKVWRCSSAPEWMMLRPGPVPFL